MADKTLVIIDMQDFFDRIPKDHLIQNMCDLIRHARRQRWGIMLVEFDRYGPTTQRLMDALGEYDHVAIVKKNCDDGGEEVIQCLDSNPQWSRHCLVCGIYGDACVRETVCGMYNADPLVEIDVVTDLVVPQYVSKTRILGKQLEREVRLAELQIPNMAERMIHGWVEL